MEKVEKRGRGRPAKKHKNDGQLITYTEPCQIHQSDGSTPMLNSIHVPFLNYEKRGRGRPPKKHKINGELMSYTGPAQLQPDPSTPLLNLPVHRPSSFNARYLTRGSLARSRTTTETKSLRTEVLAKNIDQLDSSVEVISSSEFTQAQESSSQADESVPPHQNVDGHGLTENMSTPPSTFNCTKIAEMVVNDSFDLDEVAFKADLALVTVNGYQVKEEMADLLQKIISKYGDIGQECIFRSTVQRSFQVEKVCEIYQKLGDTKFGRFTKMDLKSTMELVEDLECVKINVKWLRERLDEIDEAFRWTEGYPALKEAQETSLLAIERKKEELTVMQAELGAMVANHQKLDEALVSTKNNISSLYRYRSLVDGLL